MILKSIIIKMYRISSLNLQPLKNWVRNWGSKDGIPKAKVFLSKILFFCNLKKSLCVLGQFDLFLDKKYCKY